MIQLTVNAITVMKLLPGIETPKEHIKRLMEETERRKRDAERIVSESGGKTIALVERDNPKRGVLIHKSTKKSGCIQISYWDDRGFSGDTQEKTLLKAVIESVLSGYIYPNRRAFEEVVHRNRFAICSKAIKLHLKWLNGGDRCEGVICLA